MHACAVIYGGVAVFNRISADREQDSATARLTAIFNQATQALDHGLRLPHGTPFQQVLFSHLIRVQTEHRRAVTCRR